MSYRIKLGLALKKHREKLNFTQKEVSDRGAISQTSVTNIENGNTTNIDLILAYVKAVDYPLDIKRDFEFTLSNSKQKSEDINEASIISCTKLMKDLIKGSFLNSPKEVKEIKAKLENDLDGVITSGNLSNVLKRLVSSQELKVDTSGKKHKYFK